MGAAEIKSMGATMGAECMPQRPRCCQTDEDSNSEIIVLLQDGQIPGNHDLDFTGCTEASSEARRGRCTYDEVDSSSSREDVDSKLQTELNGRFASPSEVTLEFLDDRGNVKEVTFTQRLLGMVIRNTSPPIVGNVMPGSHAQALGVREGWQITKINGEDVTRLSSAAMKDRVNALCQHLPGMYQFDIGFDDEGESKNVTFKQAPMGMRFWTMNPFKVDKVHPFSFAFVEGVRPGWRVVNVAGKDVQQMNWEAVMQIIEDYAKYLPDQKHLSQAASELEGADLS